MTGFDYKGWTPGDAISALFDYDAGSAETGVHDETMKSAVRRWVDANRGDDELARTFARLVLDRHLNDDTIVEGYGLARTKLFIDWLDDELRYDVRFTNGRRH